jgi:hypothetical protein
VAADQSLARCGGRFLPLRTESDSRVGTLNDFAARSLRATVGWRLASKEQESMLQDSSRRHHRLSTYHLERSHCLTKLRYTCNGSSVVTYCLSSVAAVAMLSSPVTSADAHAAPSGWIYPYQCCSDRDCQPVHHAEISEGPKGYVIGQTGEIVGYKDPRVRNSPDGEFHLCAIPGKTNAKAICLFVPPRSF